jgi:hypothetical protein
MWWCSKCKDPSPWLQAHGVKPQVDPGERVRELEFAYSLAQAGAAGLRGALESACEVLREEGRLGSAERYESALASAAGVEVLERLKKAEEISEGRLSAFISAEKVSTALIGRLTARMEKAEAERDALKERLETASCDLARWMELAKAAMHYLWKHQSVTEMDDLPTNRLRSAMERMHELRFEPPHEGVLDINAIEEPALSSKKDGG